MADRLEKGLKLLGRKARRVARRATGEASLRALRTSVVSTRQGAVQTASMVAHAPMVQSARFVITSGPIKDLALICGRAGVAGAVVDGALGGMNALRAMNQGRIDGKQAVIHAGSEAGCGFLTSSSGTAGTLAAYMITGTMGPAALVAGMGASLGARYLYRQVVGETLPPEEATASDAADDPAREARDQPEPPSVSPSVNDDDDDVSGDVMEDIGPRKH
ncbi:hypothetical protein EA187_12300 [Lujinxingia sediminis]|uniref:DUF697 domain-containing protein n=1 Tax=Lujinxingia sediminis TaxID=2480984 RepID=A0ABY0CSU5_9DELT|nr:hypothetical protein [Lujinxingia sediminis]RVU43601.1 hypothetical protein EA187_12300 [Lujinxingia sediminis]